MRLPGFAPADMQSRTVAAYDCTLGEAASFYSYAKTACARFGVPIRRGSHILDLG